VAKRDGKEVPAENGMEVEVEDAVLPGENERMNDIDSDGLMPERRMAEHPTEDH